MPVCCCDSEAYGGAEKKGVAVCTRGIYRWAGRSAGPTSSGLGVGSDVYSKCGRGPEAIVGETGVSITNCAGSKAVSSGLGDVRGVKHEYAGCLGA